MFEFKLWNHIYNFMEYNQVPMNFRGLNMICIEFELIRIETVKGYYSSGARPTGESRPTHSDLLAHDRCKTG
jgi:hypothetical protein